jgi:(heptosyl)LPS beta-1,4-glucosyltransferase
MIISATIITCNEEENIADCLVSLNFVNEIIVVDSGSTDQTEEICRSNPKVKFFHHNWEGYGKQKNIAAELANSYWILNLDADERITPKLRRSILETNFNSISCAKMARENYFGRNLIRHCGWYPDYTMRLYDRRTCRFSERLVHESLEHDGKVTTLDGNLLHYTYANIFDYQKRMNSYSTLSAQEMFKDGKVVGVGSLILRPFATFIKMYIIRAGFLEGYLGIVLSLLYAQYTFCKYAKLIELRRDNTQGTH